MQIRLLRRLLQMPVSKLLYFGLLLSSAALYVGASRAAAHAAQILAAVALAISLCLAADLIPAEPIDRE